MIAGLIGIALALGALEWTEASLLRPPVEPNAQNGLRISSQLMIDKITTVSRSKLERRIGRLSKEDMARVMLKLS